jgi:DNA-binding response OmpR family regulator
MALTILVCEDEKIAHGWLVRVIKSWGHNTLSAYSGQEAIRMARESKPNVILLDMLFPDMEGVEVLKQIRENSGLAKSQVITTSATSKEDFAPKIEGLNVAASLTKPIKTEELKKLLDEYDRSTGSGKEDAPLFVVVDGSEVHQKVVERVLSEIGCKALGIDTIEAAASLLKNVKASGIVVDMDIKLSEIESALREITSSTSERLPIIVKTTSVDLTTLQVLFRNGATDILVKPISTERLKESVQKVLSTVKGQNQMGGSKGQKTVLVVEDFTITANLMEKILSGTHFKAIVARNGAQAWELIVRKKPSLMLLDLNLPGMNGMELLQRMKDSNIDVPFAAITAERNEAKLRVVRSMGALKVFKKPVIADQLLSFVQAFDADPVNPKIEEEKYKVLIALSDDAMNRHLESALKDADISYRTATDGKHALLEIGASPPVVVVEMNASGANGLEIIKKARGLEKSDQIKIVGLAEQLDEALKQEFTGIGVDALLEKPVKIEELLSQIREMLASIPPVVDIAEFADQFLAEFDKLPAPDNPSYLEQVKRLGHNLAGTAGLISNTQLRDDGISLENAAKEQKAEVCQEQVKKLRGTIEQLAAKARLIKA